MLGGLVLHALAVMPHAGAEVVEETVLAESDFLWDVDGWTIRGAAENFQHGQKMIKAADKGPDTWYFVAPGKFLGAKRAAYGGKLSFRHGFFEYNRCCSNVIPFSVRALDPLALMSFAAPSGREQRRCRVPR